VLPSEIMGLKNLKGYFESENSIVPIHFEPNPVQPQQPAFVPRPIKADDSPLLVETPDARSRLVLHACDAAERVLELVASWLFDAISESAGILADPDVARHNRDQLGRLAEFLGCRKMHGVKRADGFHWKGPADTGEYGLGDGDDIATAVEDLEPSDRTALLGRFQTPGGSGADDRPGRLGECQCGGHLAPLRTQRSKG